MNVDWLVASSGVESTTGHALTPQELFLFAVLEAMLTKGMKIRFFDPYNTTSSANFTNSTYAPGLHVLQEVLDYTNVFS